MKLSQDLAESRKTCQILAVTSVELRLHLTDKVIVKYHSSLGLR